MTLKDLAKELNLSMATISKALNDSSDISAETKKAICEYAEAVGYRSRKSVTKKGRLAVLWGRNPHRSDQLSKISKAFCAAAEDDRYIVTELETDDGFDLNEYLANNRFFGALLLDINFLSPVYSQLKETKFPLVLVDNYIGGQPLISSVGSDNIHAVQEAVDYLVSLGHRNIAFLGGELESLVGSERLAGYILGLAKNSIQYRYDITFFGDYSYESGVRAAEYYLSNDKRFTAVVCASDIMAQGLIARMKEAGKNLPEDFSVIGYDGIENPEPNSVALTSIKQDFKTTGETAYRMLDYLIKGHPAQRTFVSHSLIVRGSTAKHN